MLYLVKKKKGKKRKKKKKLFCSLYNANDLNVTLPLHDLKPVLRVCGYLLDTRLYIAAAMS